ncbi:hypothetical protein LEP1GSC060_3112 [Leptospira weilii serovar Ranarum str. ICFT]|uniref:Uncharacterized protein n=1 Tax=Leptospira weilii serovar Ranarum str. ICFT TaxID=1218598 RepID=N1WIE7_9LEPT|nr:hypothetical protein LEP1GSC060_3112 [Leptospira weilii serovar Ranarum str. ICFT]
MRRATHVIWLDKKTENEGFKIIFLDKRKRNQSESLYGKNLELNRKIEIKYESF